MANKELRGATRRDFVKGAMAIGAALGWGPTRIWELIERGGGSAAAADCGKSVQNLVVLVGGSGAHGYATLLFPHSDIYTSGRVRSATMDGKVKPLSTYEITAADVAARRVDEVAVHFSQNATNGGSSMVSAFPTLRTGFMNTVDYTNPAAEDDSLSNNWRGKWALGERYKFVYGADNQAFGGYTSDNAMSRANDKEHWGAETVPSNVNLDKGKKFLVMGRETPWLNKFGLKKGITAIDGGGINVFHVNGSHNHFINFDKKQSVFAAAATIQLVRPTIVPVILVGAMDATDIEGLANTDQFYGSATKNNMVPGQPAAAFVANSAGMVDLFNSNAARAGGALVDPRNAVLYEAYTKGFLGNSKTARLPSFARGYRAAKLGANLVGLSLADQLRPTDADRLRYGYTSALNNKFTELRDNLIVAAKALKLGLTSQVVIRYFNDDPHNSFSAQGQTANTGDNAATVALAMSNFLNAFMDDLMSAEDRFCPGKKVGDNTVVALVGDTPRTQISKNNWNDPTFGSQNRAFIMSNGLLKTGFFGGDRPMFFGQPATNNSHTGQGPGEGGLFDPRTGDLIPFTARMRIRGNNDPNVVYRYGELAMAAVLYAVSGGDTRRVNDFYPGNFEAATALYNPVLI